MMNFDIARSEIAKEYCRSILVVDDEIFEVKDGGPLRKHYKKFFESCESEGVLCHMHQYSAQSSDDNAAIKKVAKLAKKSDIIILDWFLWHSDPAKRGNSGSSEATIEILTQLIDQEELKFIFIYTNVDDINDVVHTLKDKIESNFQNITERVSTTQLEDSKDPQYFSINKLFIGIHHKKEAAEEDSAHLLELVQELLEVSYSDYLHWAGLELSTRIRDLMPQILASLPTGTNGPVLYQHLFQEEGELSDQTTEVILDELRAQMVQAPIKIFSDEVLSSEYKKLNIKELEYNSKGEALKQIDQLSDQYIVSHYDIKDKAFSGLLKKSNLSAEEKQKFKKSLQLTDSDKKITESVLFSTDDHQKWANFRESMLLKLTKNSSARLVWPGYIYKKSSNSNEYLLCISPACDCYRPENKQLLFVKGNPTKEGKSEMTQTKTVVDGSSVNWSAKKVFTFDINQIKDNYQHFGALRKDFVNRIIQRVWNHQTRVGVDSSELLRRIRKE